MNNWKQFIETKNGYRLRKFFMKLNREIADVNLGNGIKGAVLLLNTRKGYWTYKIFARNESDRIADIEVRSDRYIKKLLDFSSLEGKIVYLVDDTLNSGVSLLETYELLVKHLESKYVCPVVFALHEMVDVKKKAAKCRNDIQREFWGKLKYYIRLTGNELGEFSIVETELIHAEGIPFVIDLPYLSGVQETENEQKMNFSVKLNNEQFEALQKDDELWRFHFTAYNYGNYGEGESERKDKFKGFIIQMKDEGLLCLTEEFAHDYVIEGSYREDENGDRHVVFIPFAILKSQDFELQDQLWKAMFPGKKQNSLEAEQENFQRKKYRENVFVLSMMVAQNFRDYLKDRTGISLRYDYDILRDHFTDSFIEEIKQLELEMEKDSQLVRRRLEDFAKRKPETFSGKEKEQKSAKKRVKYSEAAAGNLFSEKLRIIKDWVKAQLLSGDLVSDIVPVLSFEEIQQSFDEEFEYQSPGERRYALTRVIIIMLSVSVCGNKLILDTKNHRMVRGFLYGENTELLLPFFNVYYYWAVLLWNVKYGRKKALQSYDMFAVALKRKFEEWNFLDTDIEKSDFVRNVDYFKSQMEDDADLNNKYCFVMPYMQGHMGETESYYMEKIEDFVKKYEC